MIEAQERVWPDVAVPPGETLAEVLEASGMTQAELARRMGRPAQAINEMIQGEKALTAETALQLEKVLGTPAHVWTRLEADYRFVLARLAQQKELQSQVREASRYPYSAMARLGWVDRTANPLRRVEDLQRFFGVAALRQVPLTVAGVAFRKSSKVSVSAEALAAWLRQGEREAQTITTGRFDAKKLRQHLSEVRAMTLQAPEDFEPRLRGLLAGVGIALVLVPHLPRTGANGATRWGGQRAIVQMSLRYRWEDVFWFSLFHELGHVLLHPRGEIFVKWNSDGRDDKEREADRFAADQLVPSAPYERFVAPGPSGYRSEMAVREFARTHGIAPSIVVGRLQHDGLVPHSHLNGLRRQFAWAESDETDPRRDAGGVC